MGLFNYAFVNLSPDQMRWRRQALDLNATIAQVSIGVILALIQVGFMVSWVIGRFGKRKQEWTPSSPYVKAGLAHEKKSVGAGIVGLARRLKWWMGEPVIEGYGTMGEWFIGSIWMAWLLALCVRNTGVQTPDGYVGDYMHLAKRFGIIGASQLPLHYLLAIKSPYSPIQLLTRTSHEQLNIAHQILGRIIQVLLTLHATFYLNFMIKFDYLKNRIKDRDVIIGLTGITLITLIGTTALRPLRKWNYRVFYYVHILIATFLLPLLYFHVVHIRIFILESAAVYVLHIILRFVSSKTYPASLTVVPGTNLTQISIPVSTSKNWKAGQHVYLTAPGAIPSTFGTVGTLKNPFTVASLPKKDGNVVLLARTLNGNTRKLASKARTVSVSGSTTRLQIEGPYGISSHLPNFSTFDRILLVAGGVGATFIIPIYRSILLSRLGAGNTSAADIRLVWSVRKLSDTTWALPIPETSTSSASAHDMGAEQELYITGTSEGREQDGEYMELAERENLVGSDDGEDSESGLSLEKQGVSIKHRRPDLREILHETFRGHAGKVAVIVCGPSGMGSQLRREVGRFVRRGRDVYFHAEEFGL